MRTEQKNKHMQEANRLAEMEYMKSREEMGVPSPSNETVLSYGTDEDPIDDYNDSEPEEDFEKRFSFFHDFSGSQQLVGAQLKTALDDIFKRISQDMFNETLAKW